MGRHPRRHRVRQCGGARPARHVLRGGRAGARVSSRRLSRLRTHCSARHVGDPQRSLGISLHRIHQPAAPHRRRRAISAPTSATSARTRSALFLPSISSASCAQWACPTGWLAWAMRRPIAPRWPTGHGHSSGFCRTRPSRSRSRRWRRCSRALLAIGEFDVSPRSLRSAPRFWRDGTQPWAPNRAVGLQSN